jgi:hypothetical protein
MIWKLAALTGGLAIALATAPVIWAIRAEGRRITKLVSAIGEVVARMPKGDGK